MDTNNDVGNVVKFPCDFSHIGAAREFARRHGSSLKYSEGLGWIKWDGKRWAKATKDDVTESVKEFADAMLEWVGSFDKLLDKSKDVAEIRVVARDAKRWVMSMRSLSGLRSIIKLAKSESEISIDESSLDSDKDLLNCANGTVNLRTGKIQPHDPSDYITRICPVDYVSGATSKEWECLFNRPFGDAPEIIGFMRRYLGYSVTGHTKEHCFSMLLGAGGNGKSVLTEACLDALGDYACKAKIETVCRGGSNSGASANPDLIALRGKRFVALSEIDKGRKLAVGRIKDLTGGDTICARALYSEQITFQPEFKLLIFGNEKLQIEGKMDGGLFRRINLVDFGETIPPAERDRDLPYKLREKENQEAILAWLVAGAMEWYQNGLDVPEVIQEAVERYREDCDSFGQWLIERCADSDAEQKTPAKELYTDYKDWCREAGYTPTHNRDFAHELRGRGYASKRVTAGMVYLGIAIKS